MNLTLLMIITLFVFTKIVNSYNILGNTTYNLFVMEKPLFMDENGIVIAFHSYIVLQKNDNEFIEIEFTTKKNRMFWDMVTPEWFIMKNAHGVVKLNYKVFDNYKNYKSDLISVGTINGLNVLKILKEYEQDQNQIFDPISLVSENECFSSNMCHDLVERFVKLSTSNIDYLFRDRFILEGVILNRECDRYPSFFELIDMAILRLNLKNYEDDIKALQEFVYSKSLLTIYNGNCITKMKNSYIRYCYENILTGNTVNCYL